MPAPGGVFVPLSGRWPVNGFLKGQAPLYNQPLRRHVGVTGRSRCPNCGDFRTQTCAFVTQPSSSSLAEALSGAGSGHRRPKPLILFESLNFPTDNKHCSFWHKRLRLLLLENGSALTQVTQPWCFRRVVSGRRESTKNGLSCISERHTCFRGAPPHLQGSSRGVPARPFGRRV